MNEQIAATIRSLVPAPYADRCIEALSAAPNSEPPKPDPPKPTQEVTRPPHRQPTQIH